MGRNNSAVYFCVIISALVSCTKKGRQETGEDNQTSGISSTNSSSFVKLANEECIDPNVSKLHAGETFMRCDGTFVQGTYVAPDLTNLTAANIKSGVTIGGITGSYSGASEPSAWDLRYGVTVGSTTGKLKVNCRNMVGQYNSVGPDFYDGGTSTLETVEDSNEDGGGIHGGFPSTNPWGSEEYFCGFNSPTDPNWEKVTTSPATSGIASVYLDKITNLNWTRGNEPFDSNIDSAHWDNAAATAAGPTADFGATGAVEYCDGLSHGGISTWRLPTQKEMMEAYAHGIHDLDNDHTAGDNLDNLDDYFWTSTTKSDAKEEVWRMSLNSANLFNVLKTTSNKVICVSE